MKNLKILIVEGNLKEENQSFLKVGIETHTESLIYSLKLIGVYYVLSLLLFKFLEKSFFSND